METRKMNGFTQPAAARIPEAEGHEGTEPPFPSINPSSANVSNFALSTKHLQFS